MMHWFLPLFPLFLLYLSVLSGDVSQGGTCSLANDHLDPASHKFLSDCDDITFCSVSQSTSSNGTCQPRQCRRDEFPFGYTDGQPIPSLCRHGSFCPDEGSACKALLGPGDPCQLNRDDQCAPPPDWQSLASNQNFNGSICLQSTCMYANVSLGQTCIIDNVVYIDGGPNGQQYSNSIIRDNCETPRFYCDRNSTQCVPTKALTAACEADRECQSYNCDSSGTCAQPPQMPMQVASWKYVVTGISVLSAMVATIVMLVLLHKRLRLKRYREIHEYYEEQMGLRCSMAALHAAAAEQYEDEKGGFYDEQTGMWHRSRD